MIQAVPIIPDNFFYDENKKPALFLPNKKGDPVPVRKVRMREFMGKAVQLKEDINQWVNPYNNHHIVIYETDSGELKEDVVSFWDVIERVNQGESMFKLPEDGVRIITTLQENDMFLLGLSEDMQGAVRAGQMKSNELSKYLYRVQKIAGSETFMELCFRHHLDSRRDSEAKKDYIYIKGFGNGVTGWGLYKPLKVKISLIVLRAAVARALTGSGLLPTLGIFHHNKYNRFCLADDIMEPFRPFVDNYVYGIYAEDERKRIIEKEDKLKILEALTTDVMINKKLRPLIVALSQTTASLARCFALETRRVQYPGFP